MAKKRVKKEVPLTRKQISRREKERRQRYIMIGIASLVGVLIVAILSYGFYMEQIVKPSSPVAVVNGVPIPTTTYQKRVLLERMNIDAAINDMQFQKTMFDPDADQFLINLIDQQISQLMMQRTQANGEDFVNGLIQEELIRQAAEENGVVVSSEEVERQIESYFGYYREPPTPVPSPTSPPITPTPEVAPAVSPTPTTEISPTATPTPMTRERFEELYGQFLSNVQETTGMSEAEYRETVEASLLREKMEESIGEEVPTHELQIRARHILVETREEAERVLERLDHGEDFGSLARVLSQDPGSAQERGDLGWFPQGQMVPEFDEVAFNLRPGEISDIVETSFGFHIILVEERDGNRELDPTTVEQRIREAFELWLLDLEAQATIERYWSTDKVPPE
jgi:parvulin-like peptidyl-prolyl isomerase